MEAIENCLPYHVYHFVQNCESSQEMMETLTMAYKGTVEVQGQPSTILTVNMSISLLSKVSL